MFIGLDVIAVRLLASLLQQVVSEITQLTTQINSQLDSVEWVGNDRQQFQQTWEGEYRTQLQNICNDLEEFSGVAERNASEQEAVSAA